MLALVYLYFNRVSECDSFTKSLYDIFLEVQSEGNVQVSQSVNLTLHCTL